MNNGDDLREAIRAAGGLNPFDTLIRLVSPEGPRRWLDQRSPLLQELLEYLRSNRSNEGDARVKEILWDARTSTLRADQMTAEEKAWRLEALDEIGRILFTGPTQ